MKITELFKFGDASDFASQSLAVIVPLDFGKAELLSAISEQLNFPEYFGGNFDALSECLADLSWLQYSKIVLLHEGVPLSGEDSSIYLRVLAGAIEEQGGRLVVCFPARLRGEVLSHFL